MPRRSIFIFLTIVICFLSLIDAVIWSAFTLVFNIYGPAQIWIGIIIWLLSMGFVAATILGNYYYNWFTRTFYIITAVWIGTSIYLFLASVLFGIIALFDPNQNIGLTLFLIAIIASIYGIIHAKNIQIKNISVTLPDLPEQWKEKKVVFISDLHLGQLHGRNFAQKVRDMIEPISPDLIFIGGDLFDGTVAPNLIDLISPFKRFANKTYFVTGNHEQFGHGQEFLEAVKSTGINLLLDKKIEIDGVQIIGIDYRTGSNPEHLKNLLNNLKIQNSSILIKHEPNNLDILTEAGISFGMFGHTHKAQMWPLEYVGRLIYKNHIYGLQSLGKMQTYTSSGTGSWGPPIRVLSDCEIVSISFTNI